MGAEQFTVIREGDTANAAFLETEAAMAHDAAAIRLHGEFARLNFPREENHVEGS